MLEQIAPLWDTFLSHRQQSKPLVLATLVSTEGSSYKKKGAMLLIEDDLTTHGLISGGCLEADVAAHAESVFDTGQVLTLNYDLSDDSIFGLGAGCDGSIQIVLQLLKDDYLPFSALDPKSADPIRLHIQYEVDKKFPIGSFGITSRQSQIESAPGFLQQTNPQAVLVFSPAPRVLVCGAGIDALPLIKVLQLLHWDVVLVDHRPGRLQQAALDTSLMQLRSDFNSLDDTFYDVNPDAVVCMTHNLDHDAAYLQYFWATPTPWIGLLGPIKRRDKVLKKAGIDPQSITSRLHAPVGLDLGGQMPENIAVSIVAQLQQHFYQAQDTPTQDT